MPNIFADGRGQEERTLSTKARDKPLQALTIGTGETSSGVVDLKTICGPFRLKTEANAPAGVLNKTVLPAKPGIRYFIHSVRLSEIHTAAHDNYGMYISVQQNGAGQSTMLVTIPSAAQANNLTMVQDVLCDENTAVTMYVFTVNYTLAYASVAYAEVLARDA